MNHLVHYLVHAMVLVKVLAKVHAWAADLVLVLDHLLGISKVHWLVQVLGVEMEKLLGQLWDLQLDPMLERWLVDLWEIRKEIWMVSMLVRLKEDEMVHWWDL